METVGDVDNIGNERPIAFLQHLIIGQKLAVQLQAVEVQFLPYINSRVSGTEIIDGDVMAVSPQLIDQMLGSGEFLQQNGLRQFKFQKLRRNPIFGCNLVEHICRFGISYMETRQIDRNANNRQSPVHPVFQELTDLSADDLIQLNHRSLRFHQIHKFIGRNYSPVITDTPCQRLRPYDHPVRQIHLRLQIETETVFMERIVDFQFIFMHGCNLILHGMIVNHGFEGILIF